ncbi:TonB-dependent siderophore receptor [Steroidobacter sp.]|uniref:TonB-dependent siderophore receptor n=1 Tax=Steroidobacter sp. TaxID=1978227 RepID=UPI001A387D29|nr:TonB-dependent receptor [Steroidobacter sp.]MBL8265180.1 TonB-dependent siderophore receptor [Steroidobacter sp.]
MQNRFSLAAAIACALTSSLVTVPVLAQSEAHLELPAQPMSIALRTLGKQTKTNILFDPAAVRDLSAPAISRASNLEDALAKLLVGSGLTFRFVDAHTITLIPADAASTNKISFTQPESRGAQRVAWSAQGAFASGAEADTTADADVIATVNVFATLEERLSVGSKSGGTLRDTPQSITVMTGERIEAQNLTSLQEVLIQTTGVTVGAFNALETFYYSRGIKLEKLQFDGGAPAYTGGLGFFYTPDTATIERVEVLRGVDGMYSGAGEPGGVINLVRKRPEDVAALRVSLSGGTWDNYRAVLDGTGPLALDGRLRGRAVASYMDRGYHLDRYTTEKQIVYGTMEFDATDSTLIAVGANYEKRDDGGFPAWTGLPRYSDGRLLELPREFSPAPSWAHWTFETQEFFGRVEQKYGETGVLRLNVNQIEQDSELNYLAVQGAVNPATLAGSTIYGTRADYSSIQRMLDLSASGKLDLFGRSHSYTVGMDYTALDGGQLGYVQPGFEYSNMVPINYFNYDPNAIAEPVGYVSSYYPERQQSQQGFYATVGIQLADPLRLTLGGRYGKFRYKHALKNIASGVLSRLRYDEQEFIPSAALSYSLSDQWTAYVSYGETFKAQGNQLKGPPPGGEALSPISGDNLELGIKGDVFQGVTAAASVYRLIREGQGRSDPAYAGQGSTNPTDGTQCCFIQQGKITVEGMDLEMSGQVMPGWQVFGGYTFTQTDYVGTATGVSTLGRTPKHQLKIWNTYQLPGRFSAVTVNAGVTSQSSAYYDIYAYGGMTLWNASVQYVLNDSWTVALSGDNLTDKSYWQPTGELDRQNVYGTPRSLTLSLRGHW